MGPSDSSPTLAGNVRGLNAIPNEHAHPNIDYKKRIALFHNGFIANYDELFAELKELGVPIYSD